MPPPTGISAFKRFITAPEDCAALLCALRSSPEPPDIAGVITPLTADASPRGIIRTRPGVHEFLGVTDALQHAPWSPPIGMLLHIAQPDPHSNPTTLWIGRELWPYGPALSQLAPASLFIDAPDAATRLWAAETALRSNAVGLVIADSRAFTRPATQRLQLAANAANSVCLLARPATEQRLLSAAASRWLISPASPHTQGHGWSAQLLRCKGEQPSPHAPRVWRIVIEHETGAFRVSADVEHQSRPAALPALRESA